MFHKIQSVAPLDRMWLLVTFCEGVSKKYDVEPLIESIPQFMPLRDVPGLWQQVSVDVGGHGISWNDDIDIACNELWGKGITVATPFDDLMAFTDASVIWGISDSTLRKALAYGRLTPGIDCLKYGKQWLITRAAMTREYGEPKN